MCILCVQETRPESFSAENRRILFPTLVHILEVSLGFVCALTLLSPLFFLLIYSNMGLK